MSFTVPTMVGIFLFVICYALIPVGLAKMARTRGLSTWAWWMIGLVPFFNLLGFLLLALKPVVVEPAEDRHPFKV